ncbi:hypothetical protein [Niallia sp. NCCP-28]|uniref:hypothetical protein n=1 Tax=Niallia sp. NCCP-28 TaxID=2934712 RepID=UPI00208C2E86|nr:hypothetical protein [Niallia sp. NCCP-28]GKU85293.1 hypothetical protein NCCP28_46890 [Niallia sp. NCCP-28]
MKKSLEEEITALIMKNKESFYQLAYSYVRNKKGALDIVKDSIHKALKNQHHLKVLIRLKAGFIVLL